jgi:transposase-like protein
VKPKEPPKGPLDPATDEPAVRPMPRCPSCGWGNVRISRTKTTLDLILGVVSIQRFKCRSCGNYFRRWRRPSE